MYKIMLALHLLTAIFAIGPLVGAATTASRGLRKPDAGATESAARTLTIYSYASVVVVIIGMGLMSAKAPWDESEQVADIGDLWIWLSLVLWAVSVALVLAGMVPTLKKATTTIREGGAVDALVGRTAALGGITGLIYAGIVFLMVYQPGS
ncbi:hypothetical protein [Nocardioides panacisoli]|uniref:DUF2269 family protein n=1 Tax=Nocardioides panacisoli TaxID=627624 RepID=A0ABP7I2V6_9ACTN